jgi:hypothetical protein
MKWSLQPLGSSGGFDDADQMVFSPAPAGPVAACRFAGPAHR